MKKKAAKKFPWNANNVVRSIAECFSDMDGDESELIMILDNANTEGVDMKKVASILSKEMEQDVGWTIRDAKTIGPLLKKYGVKKFEVTFNVSKKFKF